MQANTPAVYDGITLNLARHCVRGTFHGDEWAMLLEGDGAAESESWAFPRTGNKSSRTKVFDVSVALAATFFFSTCSACSPSG